MVNGAYTSFSAFFSHNLRRLQPFSLLVLVWARSTFTSRTKTRTLNTAIVSVNMNQNCSATTPKLTSNLRHTYVSLNIHLNHLCVFLTGHSFEGSHVFSHFSWLAILYF